MRDARGAAKEDGRAVAVERVVARVGPFERGADRDAWLSAVGSAGYGMVVQHAGEARVGADDEGDRGGDGFFNAETGGRTCSCANVLLGDGKQFVLGGVIDPGDGERVILPRADAAEAEVGVGARLDVDVAREAEGHAAGLAGHGLDEGGGDSASA